MIDKKTNRLTLYHTYSIFPRNLYNPLNFFYLILKEADLEITDLTITAARESVVDFTNPFMNLGT